MGAQWLEAELRHALETFQKGGDSLFNAGPARDSLLPFPWFNGHLKHGAVSVRR
jgi:hypothetical protein